MPDVDRLRNGHVTVGRWSLAQICNHLAKNVRFSIDGYPDAAPRVLRWTVGAVVRTALLRSGRMGTGIQVPEIYLPAPGLDAAGEVDALRTEIERFRSHRGAFAGHPFFGRMRPGQWERFHCIHSAHHLSFAFPSLHPVP